MGEFTKFRCLQRGKVLEQFVYWDNCYPLSVDGTQYFSSDKIHCPSCQEKHSHTGKVTYSHAAVGAAIVHPVHCEVIPLCPEPIIRQHGVTKNDCERNATRRFLNHIRKEHPHPGFIVVEDGLCSNGPHMKGLLNHHMHFILGAKPGDHPFLFEKVAQAIDEGRASTWETYDPVKGEQNSSNETFNTLKTQGYHAEHNYGHGYHNLSTVLLLPVMLAFLVDQTQQLACPRFRAAFASAQLK